MCGIAGIVAAYGCINEDCLPRCVEKLSHRGPDDHGIFVADSKCAGLVHTRLAILDLSSAGHQPMATEDGRFVIVFNGEIYNFRELRRNLVAGGVRFHSDSDTEVVLQLFAKQGSSMVESLAGMFAFAIWDRDNKSIFLARDPLGVKPLYVCEREGRLTFASELRAVLATGLSNRKLDREALARFLLFGSVQEPDTLVDDIKMLPAGHSLLWRDGRSELKCYWEPVFGSDRPRGDDAIESTRAALDESIDRHFVSDVPVSIFLSGGIDSTALVGLASASGHRDLKTFCISFDEAEFNEGDAAARTAAHFRTDHHDWRMTAADGEQLVGEFLGSLDQPSNDGFNSYCVSKFARDSGMKVVLSGLGGDELFGGYPTFVKVPQLLRWHARTRWLGSAGKLISGAAMQLAGRVALQPRQLQAERLNAFLESGGSPLAAYWTMRSFFTPDEVEKLVGHFTGQQSSFSVAQILDAHIPPQPTDKDSVAYLETTRYMRNQLLRDSDVMSMVHGLELRVPFVDQRLFKTLSSISSDTRLAAGKKLLLDAVPEIPSWIANAPKRGFRFPFEQWASSQWKDVFEELERLSPVRLCTWYRKWTLFTLQHFLKANAIA